MTDTAFRTIAAGKNQNGTAFRLMSRNGTFSVFKLCGNYSGRMRGGMSYTWRYQILDAAEGEARKCFDKALAGRGK